jgi:hypothetical protein
MRFELKLAVLGCLAAGVSGVARAETYEAQIYGVPAGYDWMQVSGTSNTGDLNRFTMTGFAKPTSASLPQACYLTNSGFRNMNPAGWVTSRIWDSWDNTYHVGAGSVMGAYPYRALFWIGGGPAVNLHPSEYDSSEAFGGGGQQQVGYVEGEFMCPQCGFIPHQHAGVWTRTATSFKRLHATDHQFVRALGTDGIHQVGEGFNRTTGELNALLWNGPGSMAVNLHPAGYTASSASFTVGNLQGGYVKGPTTGSRPHAAIWVGSNAVTDVNPNATFSESRLVGMQMGFFIANGTPISTPTRTQAFAYWGNTASAWINLHARLPYPFIFWNSYAKDINAWGDVIGYIEKDGVRRPVMWVRH